MPAFRQNNFQGAGQSQEEYFRSQQQPNHPHPNQPHRQFRGARGQGRGAPFPQHGQDRRFSGPDGPAVSPAQRGRGANTQWTPGPKRGGGPPQPATGPNSIRTSPALSQPESREPPAQREEPPFQPPRGPQADEAARQEYESNQQHPDNSQNNKDPSKISFAFKSKPPPQSPVRPPSDLATKAKSPPTRPALDRQPPTQPRKNKPQDRRYQSQNFQQERRRDEEPPQRLPPKGPAQQQQHVDRSRPVPTEPRGRSRSPPPKKLKQDLPPPKPTLTPEMAASDSIYFRKPGNESVVGAGTYGKVFKAIHIFTKDKVALKKIRMEGERDGFPITAVREIKLLQNLRHKHVVALQEVMVEKNECFMVFEYMSHDLTGLINHPTFKLTAAHKKDLGRQMFEGLEFLHRRGVMHRDIKAANLLISNSGQLKYADFGLARFYTKSRKLDYTNRVITIWYRPPELLLGETQYGPAVDIWSAACVFMEMFTRKAIFPGEGGELSQLDKIYNVLGTPSRHEWPEIADMPWYELMQPATATDSSGARKKRVFEANFGEVLSPAAMDLTSRIFRYDPAARPDAAEILKHEYFCVEEPRAQQAWELEGVGGDWHEYESKAHRRENEKREKERRKEEYVREKEKRKREAGGVDGEGSGKKMKGEGARVDEAPAAPLPVGEEEDMDVGISDGEGSARMSMS
ncbi:serine/threonine protein kinase, CMGC, CDC2/CDK sub [Knufia fluminis]|uniref:cyclin-dependent kinase n=1 Tax=Knufia fluminis TaxID=191047 RepID=A0AAN8I5T8_9EURO|nr:serine/threonine protein kinase, CMGC, CDC2/CDK sub [Knufia fluminis]